MVISLLQKSIPASHQIQLPTVIRPHECALGIAIPLTREDFFREMSENSNKDFIRHFARKFEGFTENYIWQRYEDELKIVNQTISVVEQKGVRITKNLTLEAFGNLFQGFQVVSLFSHWKEASKQIEFYDRLYTIDDVSAVIPTDYKGILDFTVCNSAIFAQKFKENHRESQVIVNRNTTHLAYRMLIYRGIIELLVQQEMDYSEAVMKLRLDLVSL
jgi:hypothetical protein